MSPRAVGLQNNADEAETGFIRIDATSMAVTVFLVAVASCSFGYFVGRQTPTPRVVFGNDCTVAPLVAGGSR